MRDSFINLKDSKDGTAVFCIVDYIIPMRIGLTYKHDGMSYKLEIPQAKTNAHLKEGDEVEMQLFIMKEIKDDV